MAATTITAHLASAELYDPATGTWTTTGSLNEKRSLSHGDVADQRQGARRRRATATVSALAERGTLRSSERAPGRPLAASLPRRDNHTATLLPNGKVLVAGGRGGGFLASAELYDPATGTWTATGSLAAPAPYTRRRCCLTARCSSHAVLATAAISTNISRARSSTTRRAGPGPPPAASPMHALSTQRRCCPTARCSSQGGATFPATPAELYDPASGDLDRHRQPQHRTLHSHGSVAAQRQGARRGRTWLLRRSRERGTLRLRRAGPGPPPVACNPSLLFTRRRCYPTVRCWSAGGSDSVGGPIASAELYDPADGNWTTTRSLATARESHTATLLPNGKVLVAAGSENAGAISRARNSMIRRWRLGRPPVVSMTRALSHGNVAARRQGARRGWLREWRCRRLEDRGAL